MLQSAFQTRFGKSASMGFRFGEDLVQSDDYSTLHPAACNICRLSGSNSSSTATDASALVIKPSLGRTEMEGDQGRGGSGVLRARLWMLH